MNSFERMTYEAVDFTDRGHSVVIEVIQRGWTGPSDRPVELRHWAVATAGGGELRRLELFLDQTDALEAAEQHP